MAQSTGINEVARYGCAWWHRPFSGHWIAEERPDFLIDELERFFSE